MHKAFMWICVLLLFLSTCSQVTQPQTTEIVTESTENITLIDKGYSTNYGVSFESIQEEVMLGQMRVEAELEIKKMTEEIKDFWVYFYNKKEWPIRELHQQRFDKHSRELAEVVYYFKRNESDLGGQLPNHKDTHIFMAMMVAKETAVDPTARGLIGEVGLIQCHGAALNGHKPQEVLDDPRLGLYLGVRWLTSKMRTCRKDIDLDNWENKMWEKPLTIYAAGEGNGRASRGHCETISVARRRVYLATNYLRKRK